MHGVGGCGVGGVGGRRDKIIQEGKLCTGWVGAVWGGRGRKGQDRLLQLLC